MGPNFMHCEGRGGGLCTDKNWDNEGLLGKEKKKVGKFEDGRLIRLFADFVCGRKIVDLSITTTTDKNTRHTRLRISYTKHVFTFLIHDPRTPWLFLRFTTTTTTTAVRLCSQSSDERTGICNVISSCASNIPQTGSVPCFVICLAFLTPHSQHPTPLLTHSLTFNHIHPSDYLSHHQSLTPLPQERKNRSTD